MKRRIDRFIIAIIVAVAGCAGQPKQRPWKTLSECEQENTSLSIQVEQIADKNAELTQQIKTLTGLDSDERLEAINTLEKIRIGKRTGFYDKDNNGTREILIVYLKPSDTAQDTIKAIGKVDIGLWDLEDPSDTLVERWEIDPERLHTTWGGTIFDSYYRLECPLENTLAEGKEYTVKVTFSDYLTGKVLANQTVITP